MTKDDKSKFSDDSPYILPCEGCVRASHGAPCAWAHTGKCVDQSMYELSQKAKEINLKELLASVKTAIKEVQEVKKKMDTPKNYWYKTIDSILTFVFWLLITPLGLLFALCALTVVCVFSIVLIPMIVMAILTLSPLLIIATLIVLVAALAWK